MRRIIIGCVRIWHQGFSARQGLVLINITWWVGLLKNPGIYSFSGFQLFNGTHTRYQDENATFPSCPIMNHPKHNQHSIHGHAQLPKRPYMLLLHTLQASVICC